jgi:hypothetical protein
MPIAEWIEKLGRAIFERPFNAVEWATDVPELAEIRLAVLDQVKAKAHQVGGRSVFPYNAVRIHLAGVPAAQAPAFTGKFFAEFCRGELHAGLARSNYRFPDDLEVIVDTTTELPGPKDQWLRVDVEFIERQRAAPVVAKRGGKVVVLRGAANVGELQLTKARTNIGRTVDIFRSDGPSRRNDLAFHESDEISRTVSREHAHIAYSKKDGEYRLFNDRAYTGSCGLWIIRDGMSHEVHRDPRGARLEAGDEISLGRALVKFVSK